MAAGVEDGFVRGVEYDVDLVRSRPPRDEGLAHLLRAGQDSIGEANARLLGDLFYPR